MKNKRNVYTRTRQVHRRRDSDMDFNAIHDREYTFADEYYLDLQNEFLEDMQSEIELVVDNTKRYPR